MAGSHAQAISIAMQPVAYPAINEMHHLIIAACQRIAGAANVELTHPKQHTTTHRMPKTLIYQFFVAIKIKLCNARHEYFALMSLC